MELSSSINRNDALMPPMSWDQEKLETAFTEYIQSGGLGNSRNVDWRLFSLTTIANQARLVSTFDRLLSIEQAQGFTPLPHQIATAEKVLKELHGRAILADEVGLGKTIEAGLILKEYQLRELVHKTLILVPASLVLQWTRELNEKFRVGAYAQRNEWSWSQYDVVVASLDTAKREPHRTQILSVQWDMLIVDEAHKLKNSKSKNWQTVNEIPNKYMLLLTATPMQNNLKELHTLITLLKPGHLGSRHEFSSKHMVSARQAKDASRLKGHLHHVMIRNKRRDGVIQLPNRHVSAVSLQLNADERTLYDAVQRFLKAEYQNRKEHRLSVLPLVTLQREICSSPYAAMITMEKMMKRSKDPELKQTLSDLLQMAENVVNYTKVNKVLEMLSQIDDKCIIFTEYRATQDFLMYMLKKHGVSAVPFRGGFGRGKKDWMKDLFAKKVKVLVATESGGEGINLQFCHHMINFDLPWNPMRLEQRIGRIHRLGQEQEVYIYNLSTTDTIEQHIVELLQEKIRMFESVIGELDYIVDERPITSKIDEEILDMAMTSGSDGEFKQKLDTFGNEVLRQIQSGGAGVD